MPTLFEAIDMVMAQMQSAFSVTAHPPAAWQLTVGQEMVSDADIFQDGGCGGLGFVMVSGGGLELETSQLSGGSLYMRQTVTIGVLRCAPTIGDDMRSPTSAEHAAYAKTVLGDQQTMLEVVHAVSEFPWITEDDISDPAWQAIPVEGGIGGGTVTFEMAIIGDCP